MVHLQGTCASCPGWGPVGGVPSPRPDDSPRSSSGRHRGGSVPPSARPLVPATGGRLIQGGGGDRHDDPPGSGDRVGLPVSPGTGAAVVRLVERPLWRNSVARRPSRARETQVGRQVYEIRVRGPIHTELLEELGAEDLGEEPPLTILRTDPTDQPGLHGMLQRLRSLGLDLMEVRTTGPEPYVDDST